MTPQHHPRELIALKTRFRVLVDAVGGIEAASVALGYPASRISEVASPHVADRWPRVDHVAELEALAGQPLVTAQMAALAGCALAPREAPEGGSEAALLGALGAAGGLVRGIAAALADGTICARERAQLGTLLDQMAGEVAQARAALDEAAR